MAEICTGENYTQLIDRTECIGNSLAKINSNFRSLDLEVCSLGNDVEALNTLLPSLPSVVNIRLSLSNVDSVPTTDIKNAQTVFLHPYKGSTVSLWNPTLQKWELFQLNQVVSKSLAGLAANTNYDIFVFENNTTLDLEFVSWPNQSLGAEPPTLELINGVQVKPGDPRKRLIGCLRTTSAGQTEMSFGRIPAVGGSHPKFFLWNLYNQEPLSFSILETGNASTGTGTNFIRRWNSSAAGAKGGANGPFERFGGAGNKISFITRTSQVVTLNSVMFSGNGGNVCIYFSYSLDAETPTVEQLLTKTPGVPIYERCTDGPVTQAYTNTVDPGYHYIQLVSMTYENTVTSYLVYTGSPGWRHSYGTIGTLLNF